MATLSVSADPLQALFLDLQSLRSGAGLREPQRLLACSETFHHALGMTNSVLDDAQRIALGMSRLRAALDSLDEMPQETAVVELNLHEDHRFQTLTERQSSLAASRRCDPKTIRRHGNRVLRTLACLLTLPSPRALHADRPVPALVRPLSPFERLLWFVASKHVTVISGEIRPKNGRSPHYEERVFLLESQENLAIVEAVANLVTVNEDVTMTVTSSGDVQTNELLNSILVVGGPRSNAISNRLLAEIPLQARLIVTGSGVNKDKYFQLPNGDQARAHHVDGHLRRDVATVVVGPNPFNAAQRLVLVAGLHSHGNCGAVMSVSRRRRNPVVTRNLDLLALQQVAMDAYVQVVLEVPVVDGRVLPATAEPENIFVTDPAGG